MRVRGETCTLALLLSVLTQALASTNLSGVLTVFAAYAAGSATLLLTLALFAAFTSSMINHFLRRLLPHMNRITGAVLALSGAYLLLYWLPPLLDNGRPGSTALTGLAGTIAAWMSNNQRLITVTALALIVAVTITTATLRYRGTATREVKSTHDCCAPADPIGSHPAPTEQ